MRIHKKDTGHWLKGLAITSACVLFPLAEAIALPVIPGAEGFGIDTPAGRGGKVYKVTNVNASGSGSLQACIDASGPRVCVFETSGVIRLSKDMTIRNPYITIAGQTAPSPGITIRGAGLAVRTHDALIQHIRIRPGDDRDGHKPEDRDGIKAAHSHNVVFDHITVSWSTDELVSVWEGAGDISFINSIFSEPLHNSIHPKGVHGYGPLIWGGLENTWGNGPTKVSMIGNIIAHSHQRNTRTAAANFMFANNVIYNWEQRGTEVFNRYGAVSKTSLIGNVYKPGPNTGSTKGIIIQPNTDDSLKMVNGSEVFVQDNKGPGYTDNNPWSMVTNRAGSWIKASSSPVTVSGFEPLDSSEVEAHVLVNAGARPADRDSVDKRIINDIKNGTGRIINSPHDKGIGGWSANEVNQRALEVPSNPNGDSNGNGYTNLEEWLHSFSAEVEGEDDQGEVAPPEAPTKLTAQ